MNLVTQATGILEIQKTESRQMEVSGNVYEKLRQRWLDLCHSSCPVCVWPQGHCLPVVCLWFLQIKMWDGFPRDVGRLASPFEKTFHPGQEGKAWVETGSCDSSYFEPFSTFACIPGDSWSKDGFSHENESVPDLCNGLSLMVPLTVFLLFAASWQGHWERMGES